VGPYRAVRSPPFFGEGGIDPLAEPRFLVAPPQPFLEQNFVEAAALDRNVLVLREVGHQPVKRPTGKGQPQRLRVRERGGNHLGHLRGRVRRRPTAAVLVLQRGEAHGVTAADASAHRVGIETKAGRDNRRGVALAGLPEDPGALDGAGWRRSRMSQLVQGRLLVRRQLAQAQSHHAPPQTGGRHDTPSLAGRTT
jgi:hypothetical protein